MYENIIMALDGTCKPTGKLFIIFNITPRISLTEVNNFNSNVGHLESHNNLHLENHVNAPTQTDLNCVYYVPTSSGIG